MKKALIVGIDDYGQNALRGCCRDAERVCKLLRFHDDETINFQCRLLTSKDVVVSRSRLLEALAQLYDGKARSTLFYFAGHGGWSPNGGGILPQDARSYREGISMWEIQQLIPKPPPNLEKLKVPPPETVVVLDCCYSGSLGEFPGQQGGLSEFHEGMSMLAASGAHGQAEERGERGLFSGLFCAALEGGATNLTGKVSVGSVYAYVDQALGPWDQRPTFKAYLSNMKPLRRCRAPIDLSILRALPKYFEDPIAKYRLDPSYEPTEEPRHEENQLIFRHFQRLRDVGLLVPVGEPDLYYAALHRKACELTALGRYYWHLAKEGKI